MNVHPKRFGMRAGSGVCGHRLIVEQGTRELRAT
jgi:hypothetical protein